MADGMGDGEKRHVYVLKSDADKRPYIGVTSNVARRLDTHNSGGSVWTAPFRPWRLAVSIEFPTEDRALQFERYLKSGSGRAFARRHFL
jgi:predicted GIY-YIG superfamily endonuclease